MPSTLEVTRELEAYLRRLSTLLPRAQAYESGSSHDPAHRLASLVDCASRFGALLAGCTQLEVRILAVSITGRIVDGRIDLLSWHDNQPEVRTRALTERECASALGLTLITYRRHRANARRKVAAQMQARGQGCARADVGKRRAMGGQGSHALSA